MLTGIQTLAVKPDQSISHRLHGYTMCQMM